MDSAFASDHPAGARQDRQACQPGRVWATARVRGRHRSGRRIGRRMADKTRSRSSTPVRTARRRPRLPQRCWHCCRPAAAPAPPSRRRRPARPRCCSRAPSAPPPIAPAPGTRPADLRYLAVLTDLTSICRYRRTRAWMSTLALQPDRRAGPAYGGGPLRLTYFVATPGTWSAGPEQAAVRCRRRVSPRASNAPAAPRS